MKIKQFLMFASVFSLLFVDWLTFHDVFELHTTRDWLTLLSSTLVLLYFAQELSRKKK